MQYEGPRGTKATVVLQYAETSAQSLYTTHFGSYVQVLSSPLPDLLGRVGIWTSDGYFVPLDAPIEAVKFHSGSVELRDTLVRYIPVGQQIAVTIKENL